MKTTTRGNCPEDRPRQGPVARQRRCPAAQIDRSDLPGAARVTQEPLAIRQVCFEAAGVITGRHPLTAPLQALARAATELIPEAAAALCDRASELAPCPAL